jgi:hypothetical protein
MKDIDTYLFVEIILSEGVTFLYRDDALENLNVEYYHGISGKKVAICMSDESITVLTAKQYLRQLGLDDLIDRLFPPG